MTDEANMRDWLYIIFVALPVMIWRVIRGQDPYGMH